MSCQNSLWIIDWKMYGERRTEIPLSLAAMIDPLAQGLGWTGSIIK